MIIVSIDQEKVQELCREEIAKRIKGLCIGMPN